MVRRILLPAIGIGVVLVLAIQLVPYGRQHTNPPVSTEPAWPDPAVRQLAVRACFDCHSNETTWPWYSNVAPVSWLIQRDVDEGRQRLNFSDWGVPRQREREMAQIVLEGEMPPVYYGWMHPSGILTSAETTALANGLSALK
jgi:hypothetical protein